jgi:hypothetical protein
MSIFAIYVMKEKHRVALIMLEEIIMVGNTVGARIYCCSVFSEIEAIERCE